MGGALAKPKLRPFPVTLDTCQAPAAEKVFGNCCSDYRGWVIPGVLGGGTPLAIGSPPDCTLRKHPGASLSQPPGPGCTPKPSLAGVKVQFPLKMLVVGAP